MLSEEAIDMVRRQWSLTLGFRSLPRPFRALNERLLHRVFSKRPDNQGGNKEFRRGGMRLGTYPRATIFLGLVMSVLASRSKPASTRLDILETNAATFCIAHRHVKEAIFVQC